MDSELNVTCRCQPATDIAALAVKSWPVHPESVLGTAQARRVTVEVSRIK